MQESSVARDFWVQFLVISINHDNRSCVVFLSKSDVEKLEGLPVSPFMDRDKVTKPSSQIGFIRFVLLPLFIELANLFPCLEVRTPPQPHKLQIILHLAAPPLFCSSTSSTQWERPWTTTLRWRKLWRRRNRAGLRLKTGTRRQQEPSELRKPNRAHV